MQESCFFSLVEEILHTPEIEKRFELFKNLDENLHSCSFEHHSRILPITHPIYSNLCQITCPTQIFRPRIINEDSAMAAFLHSIAHIEYSAIDLALDASYRFRHLPFEFYADWIEVAREEIRHFSLLRGLLQKLGYDYGDFKVHPQLFEAMKATPNFADRMAVVHRGLEANGLDANPFVSRKVSFSSHPLKAEILEVLNLILRDEISHVSKGNHWWKYSSDTRSFEMIWQSFGYPLAKTLNIQARLQAGFSLEELEQLSLKEMP